MFNEKLLKHIIQQSPEFGKISIKYYGSSVEPTPYNLINYHLISTNIVNDFKDYLTIVYPHNDIFDILFLTYSAIAHYKKNDFENISPDELKADQLVLAQKKTDTQPKLARYMGIKETKDRGIVKQNHYLQYCETGKFTNTTEVYLPIDTELKFYKYHGTSNKPQSLNKNVSPKQKNRIKVINEIFGYDGDITLHENQEILVIADHETFANKIRNTTVNGIDFADLFPTAYYQNHTSPKRLGNDRLLRSPLIHFTSHIYTGNEIIANNPGIKSVVIIGAHKLKNNHDILLSIIKESNVEDICVLLDITDVSEAVELEKLNSSFISWCWFKDDLKRLQHMSEVMSIENQVKYNNGNTLNSNHYKDRTISEVGRAIASGVGELRNEFKPTGKCRSDIQTHNHLIELSTKENHQIIEVQYPGTLKNSDIKNARSLLKNLIKIYADYGYEDVKILALRSLKLINKLLSMPTSANEHDAYITSQKKNCITIEDSCRGILDMIWKISDEPLLKDIKHDLTSLTEIITFIKKEFSSNSQKLSIVKNIIEKYTKDKKILLVVRDNDKDLDYREITESFMSKNKVLRIPRIITSRELKSADCIYNYDLIIYTGFTYLHKDAITLDNIMVPQISVLYQSEKDDFEINKRNSYRVFHNLMDDSTKACLLGVEPQQSIITKPPDKEMLLEKTLEAEIREINIDISSYKMTHYDNNSELVNARKFILDDGYYAFIRENKKVKILNRSDSNIEEVAIDDLQAGDELVFLSGSHIETFEELIASLDTKDLTTKAKLWQIALKTFTEQNKMGPQSIVNLLNTYDISRSKQTVRMWLKDDTIIGPDEDNYKAVRAIAGITKDQKLSSCLDECIECCRKLNGLHIKIGKLLAKQILKSAACDINDLDKEIQEKIREWASHAQVASLIEILPGSCTVPLSATGKILDWKV